MNRVNALRRFCHDIVSKPLLRMENTERQFMGTEYGGWWLSPARLHSDSVVYSFGVGTDISFDLALIDRFGLTVHAFDPTPRCIEWITSVALPPQLKFYPTGLAAFDGVAAFAPPVRKDHVSYSLARQQKSKSHTAQCTVRRLKTIMGELGHTHVDLLKLDIEGAEYSVANDLWREPLSVSQALIEFHGDRPLFRRHRIAAAARQLRRIGLVPFSISETGREYSFINARCDGSSL